MASSYTSSPRHATEADFDENDVYDFNDDIDLDDIVTDEDTDDASETEMAKKEEYTEIKEQMYQDKLAQLKKQLVQLKEGTLPEYMKKMKKLEQNYKDRLRVNEIWFGYEMELVEKDYVKEKKLAAKEFEVRHKEKKIELKETLITELEDKRRHIDTERNSIELTGAYFMDAMELKPASTRKLRRRANDPIPMPEKRRKPSPDILSLLTFCLEEDDIMDDLKIINKVSGKPLMKKIPVVPTPPQSTNLSDKLYEARIDDGQLYYEKKWFTRNQPVFVESKELGKVSAVISAVGTQEIWLRKTSDNTKLRIYTSQLQKGKYLIRKRT